MKTTTITLDAAQTNTWHGDDAQQADELERSLKRDADDRTTETHLYDDDGNLLRVWAPADRLGAVPVKAIGEMYLQALDRRGGQEAAIHREIERRAEESGTTVTAWLAGDNASGHRFDI